MNILHLMPIFDLFALLQLAWLLLLVATHISLTIIVYRDAKSLPQLALGISPLLWLGITFSLPVIGMFIYWVMHYSSWSRQAY